MELVLIDVILSVNTAAFPLQSLCHFILLTFIFTLSISHLSAGDRIPSQHSHQEDVPTFMCFEHFLSTHYKDALYIFIHKTVGKFLIYESIREPMQIFTEDFFIDTH